MFARVYASMCWISDLGKVGTVNVTKNSAEGLNRESGNVPSFLALTMLGEAGGGTEFSSKNGSTWFGLAQIGYPLILPCHQKHKCEIRLPTKEKNGIYTYSVLFLLTSTFRAASVAIPSRVHWKVHIDYENCSNTSGFWWIVNIFWSDG